MNPLTSVTKDLAGTQDSEAANAPNTEQRDFDTRSEGGKPKRLASMHFLVSSISNFFDLPSAISCYTIGIIRRLLPASSALLRDFNTLDIGDKSEKPKVNFFVLSSFSSSRST